MFLSFKTNVRKKVLTKEFRRTKEKKSNFSLSGKRAYLSDRTWLFTSFQMCPTTNTGFLLLAYFLTIISLAFVFLLSTAQSNCSHTDTQILTYSLLSPLPSLSILPHTNMLRAAPSQLFSAGNCSVTTPHSSCIAEYPCPLLRSSRCLVSVET